jgi:hypothetical protein
VGISSFDLRDFFIDETKLSRADISSKIREVAGYSAFNPVAGRTVLMSIAIWPALIPLRIPFAPKTTSSTA